MYEKTECKTIAAIGNQCVVADDKTSDVVRKDGM